MSKSVDQRIVEMQFNNRQFESGIKDSLGSLDKLKKGLDLEGASKGLNNLSDAGKKFSLAGIADGVETIAGRFTTLGLIGVTAIQNIVNSAVDAGKRIVKALTIDPITTGFNEYELKMGSIQTIMAGTGASLEDVNKKLNELNAYSDKTIYSFSDMTSNIGKFTNAGVSLDQSVAAIKGVANVAAVSGANANEASRAMYNFAQALSSGYVKLIDWKSIELANMGTVEFKQQLIDAAVAAGTLAEAGKGMYKTYNGTLVNATKGFNESLTDQWMTTEVLVNTLNKYADESTDIGKKAFAAAQDIKTLSMMSDTLKESAQSGWAQSWEIISGDFNEGKTLYTSLGNAIGAMIQKSADARNEMLQMWKDNGGRAALIKALAKAFEGLMTVITPIKEAFLEIFPPVTGARLAVLTKQFRMLMLDFKIGDDTADKLKRTFKGLFAIFDIAGQAVSAIAKGIGRLVKALSPGASSLLDFTAGVGDWLVALDESIKKSGIFVTAIEKIGDFISFVATGIQTAVSTIINAFKAFGEADLSGVDTFTKNIKIRFEPFSALFDFIGKAISKIVDFFKKAAPIFYKLAGIIGDALGSLQEKIGEAIGNGDFKTVLDLINTGLLGGLLVGLRKFIDSMSNITGGVAGIIDGVTGSLEALQSSLKSKVLLNIAIAIGILAASLFVLSMIDSEKLTGSLVAITTLFTELFGAMAVFGKLMGGVGFKSFGKVSLAMIGMSVAVLILAFAMEKLAGLEWEDIEKGLLSIGALMGMLVAAANFLAKNQGAVIKGGLGFILFAAAIRILASAVVVLGEMDFDDMGKGLLAVAGLMLAIVGFTRIVKPDRLISTGIGMIAMATAIVIMSNAVVKLGSMDLASLAKGVGSLAVMLAAVAGFTQIVKPEKLIAVGVGMVFMGTALSIMSGAVSKLGSLDLASLVKGVLALAAILGAVAVFTKLVKPEQLVATSFAMVIMGTALAMMSAAVAKLGSLDLVALAKGIGGLAAVFAMIAIFTKVVNPAQMISVGAAMVLMGVSIALFAGAIEKLGQMSLAEIGKGLLALVGVFVVLGLAALVLAPLTPVMLALSGAVALLGVGMLALGAGLLLFSAGLAALAVSGTAGAAALVAIVTALIGLIPYLLEQIGLAIIAFAEVIIQGMPVIMEAVGAIFAGLIKLFGELAPDLIETVLSFILELLVKLVEYVPKFVDAGMKILIGFLKGIADNITEVVEAGIDLVLNFLEGIRRKLPAIIDMAFKMIISFINGLADAIRNNADAIYDAVENLILAIIDAIKKLIFKLVDVGGDIINGLIDGVKKVGQKLWDSVVGVVKDAVQGVKDFLGIKSPSKLFAEIGQNTGKGLIVGIESMSNKVSAASEDLGGTAVDSMTNALSGVQDAIDSDVEIQPTIRPVVDMTDVEKGLSSTFGKSQGIDVTASTNKVSSVAAVRQNGGISDGVNQTTDNTDNSRVAIHNHYVVRNDNDIRKISQEQKNLLDRYILSKGVPVAT